MGKDDAVQPVTIALDRLEIQFLLTVLESCEEILTTILALQECFPALSPPPLQADAIANIGALAKKISGQTRGTDRG